MGVDDFLGANPAKLRLGIQPYVTLLDLRYPLDEFSLALKRRIARSTTSNSAEENRFERRASRVNFPKPQRVFVAVHRLSNSIYYKRLDEPAFVLLQHLQNGSTLAKACLAAAGSCGGDDLDASHLQQWFKQWAEMGWFCKFKPTR